jgi:hypothetical protein
MNARIEELMIQAGITTNLETDLFDDEGNIGKWLDHFAEEFAQLIVRECMSLCQESIDDGCVEAEEPMRKIEKHFGVE